MILSIPLARAEERKFYSQYGQDQFVFHNFFKEKRNGVFVDIGAHDGVSFSNTYFFERFMGWTGICIEPIPEIFTQLQTNRNCICVHGCIYDRADSAQFLRVRGYPEMLSGILLNYNPQHLRRIEQEVKRFGGSMDIIQVKCYSLTQLLLDHHLDHIDYLSIDTEGGEMAILQSIDFSKIDIEVIDVENNYGERFNQFLASVGYQRVSYHFPWSPDEIYRKIRP